MNTFTAGALIAAASSALIAEAPTWAWLALAGLIIVAALAALMLHNTKRKAERSMENLRSDMERRHREEMDTLMKTMVSQMESAIARRADARGAMPGATGMPVGQPGTVPSQPYANAPAGQPAAYTGQPSGLPMGRQGNAPVGQPTAYGSQQTNMPMGQQGNIPAAQPVAYGNQPMTVPMGQPAQAPVGQPMGTQMGQPVNAPMGQMGGAYGVQSGTMPGGQPAGVPGTQPGTASGVQPGVSPSASAQPALGVPVRPASGPAEKRGVPNTNPPAPAMDDLPQDADIPQIVDDNNAARVTAHFDDHNMEVRTDGHRFTMLMVDDNADMCRFVHDYFRGVYNVFTAHNGKQALEVLAKQTDIDLVVSDVTMPQMDGMELCRRIKTDIRWSHIPVILLTGLNNQQKEMEGLKLGADDYITKPFNAEKLRLRVKSLIEKKERRQQQFREQVDVDAKAITITSVDEEFIQNAMRICEEHIADTEFSVEALGHELNLSRTYLYKKLINITGKSPNEFIRTIRMKRGKQMLERDTMQIAEISAALGYSSPKRFTENFKLEYGKSPSEYLREVRNRR